MVGKIVFPNHCRAKRDACDWKMKKSFENSGLNRLKF